MKKWGIIALVAATALVAVTAASAATNLREIKAFLNAGLNLKLAGDPCPQGRIREPYLSNYL